MILQKIEAEYEVKHLPAQIKNLKEQRADRELILSKNGIQRENRRKYEV